MPNYSTSQKNPSPWQNAPFSQRETHSPSSKTTIRKHPDTTKQLHGDPFPKTLHFLSLINLSPYGYWRVMAIPKKSLHFPEEGMKIDAEEASGRDVIFPAAKN